MIIFLGLFVFLVVLGIVAFVFLRRNAGSKFAQVIRYESEKYFTNPTSGKKEPFPSIYESGSVVLSVVVPAYNESNRMRPMLDECLDYLDSKKVDSEIIVVDDGSRDDTSKVAMDYSKKLGTNRFRVLTLEKNRGKGGAIRLGVLSSRGRKILFADADGATKFSDFSKLDTELSKLKGEGIVVGSRAHLEQQALAERSFFRNLLMYGFKMFVWAVGVRGIKDTQCGFKLFTRDAAAKCFLNLHVERWAFDVELLHIAERFCIPVAEVAVIWQEKDGSKLIPVFSWLQMAFDIFRTKLFYVLSVWEVDEQILYKKE